ncbi:MAG: hypothetical protein WAX38_03240 [Minisyncoccia bacterium]
MNVSINITGELVAWYGAVIATFAFTLALAQYFRDRTKIVVHISKGFLASSPSNTKVFITAQNHGRNLVTLTSVGLILRDGNNIQLIYPENISFPYKLNAGESVETFFDKNEIVQYRDEIKCARYTDALGKKYKAKFNKKLLD